MKEFTIEICRSYPDVDGYTESHLRRIAARTILPVELYVCVGKVGEITNLFFASGSLRGTVALDTDIEKMLYTMFSYTDSDGIGFVHLDWSLSPRIFPHLVPKTRTCPCRGRMEKVVERRSLLPSLEGEPCELQ